MTRARESVLQKDAQCGHPTLLRRRDDNGIASALAFLSLRSGSCQGLLQLQTERISSNFGVDSRISDPAHDQYVHPGCFDAGRNADRYCVARSLWRDSQRPLLVSVRSPELGDV